MVSVFKHHKETFFENIYHLQNNNENVYMILLTTYDIAHLQYKLVDLKRFAS